jgi:hypothetical protein
MGRSRMWHAATNFCQWGSLGLPPSAADPGASVPVAVSVLLRFAFDRYLRSTLLVLLHEFEGSDVDESIPAQYSFRRGCTA